MASRIYIVACLVVVLAVVSPGFAQETEDPESGNEVENPDPATEVEKPVDEKPDSTPSDEGCPEGYSRGDSHCFMVHDMVTTWLEARAVCQESGGDLASADSDSDTAAIQRQMEAAGVDYAWLGLNDREEEAMADVNGVWKWANGMTYGQYMNWVGAPANVVSSQDCVLAERVTGKWTNIAICKSSFPFVCQAGSSSQPVPPGPPVADADAKCFSADGRVKTTTGIKYMKDVSIGDKVLSRKDDGSLFYDTVYLLAHVSHDTTARFVRITVEDSRGGRSSLGVSDKHVVPTQSGAKAAEDIDTSDLLVGAHGVARVLGVSTELQRGLYNPLTLEGAVIVNDVLATVYARDIPPVSERAAHLLLWPLRATHRLLGGTSVGGYSQGGVPMPLWALDVVRHVVRAVVK